MARTNIADVKTIISTSLEDNQITSFITDSNLIVTSKFTGVTIDDDLLEAIEKWLTAHLIAMSQKRQLSDQKVDTVSMKYAGKFGLYLEHTTYGQMVIFLDSTNTMVDAQAGAEEGKITAKLRSINPDRTTYSSS
jgi:hypothetical protein